jgi:hypothetical protein
MGLRSDNDDTTTSTRVGGGGTKGNELEVDYRFLTTKVGGVSIKLGMDDNRA